MKILMALMALDIGGAETHVVELSKELRRRGHEIVIASNGGAYEKELEAAGIRHIKIPMHQRSGKSMARSLALLRQAIRREKPDLVHAHARIPAFLCGILQKTMHFPFITSAHWVFEVTPTLRVMTNWGDRTVAVSEDIRTYLMASYGVPRDQISVTINGIDTDLFRPGQGDSALRTQLGLGDGPVVCLVSRLDTSRAMAAQALVAVAPGLFAAVPGAELLIVGGGDQEAALREAAEAVNCQAGRTRIHMTGPRTDIARLVALSDVFVGVSRAALEAMSAGKPVILAGDEGYLGPLTPEKLEEAQGTNFCCRGSQPLSEDALLRDLVQLLTAPPETRGAMGEFGRQVILENYSVQRMAEDYLAAYHDLLHPPKTVNAAICGYYGYDNLGDDAILWAISRQLERLPVRLTALSRHPRETTAHYGVRAVNRFSPVRVFHTLRRCDILIFGGGSLLQDRTSTRSVRYYLWVIGLAQLLKKPVFLYANGIGPLLRDSNRRLVKKKLERCQYITLRDWDSQKELADMGLSQSRVTVTGDPAFTLSAVSERTAREKLAEQGVGPEDHIVGISVRRTPEVADAEARFAELADRIHRELHKTVAFVVMQESADLALSREIQSRMKEPSILLLAPNQSDLMLGMIGCMDAMISMRLHTLIFAAKERVPMLGCVYDPKIAAFLELVDMPSCGTPADMTVQGTLTQLEELLSRRDELQSALDSRVRVMETQATETVRLLEQLLRERKLLDDTEYNN